MGKKYRRKFNVDECKVLYFGNELHRHDCKQGL